MFSMVFTVNSMAGLSKHYENGTPGNGLFMPVIKNIPGAFMPTGKTYII